MDSTTNSPNFVETDPVEEEKRKILEKYILSMAFFNNYLRLKRYREEKITQFKEKNPVPQDNREN